MRIPVSICLAGLLFVGSAAAASATVLQDVQARGELICGVNTQLVGFAAPNEKAEWEGFNIDWCNALAAAIGVTPRYRPVSGTERFIALATGEVDVLTREDTWLMSRDIGLGITFAAPYYYETQTILTRRELNASKLADLSGATACLIAGTAGATNVAALFETNNIPFTALTLKSNVEAGLAYANGRCDFLYGDAGAMAAQMQVQSDPSEHVLLDEQWGREPYAMSVRSGDDQWLKIVRTVFNAIVLAELEGITADNVATRVSQPMSNEVSSLLGESGKIGVDLGLDNKFAYRAIEKVGNYGEMFDRHLTPIGIKRGLNKLYTEGGILYPIPFR